MRYLILALAFTACENPVEHFTDPPKKGKTITVDCRDPWTSEPLPPGSVADTNLTCKTWRP